MQKLTDSIKKSVQKLLEDASWLDRNVLDSDYARIPGGWYEAELAEEEMSQALAHINLNRYSDVLPYDSNLVPCSLGYVNASILSLKSFPQNCAKEYQDAVPEQKYIVTSGPLHPEYYGPDTVPAFWAMVQENGAKVVVSLSSFEEGFCGCADYISTHPEIVQVTSSELVCGDRVKLSRCDINSTQGKSQVTHVHFLSWPIFGIPSVPRFLTEVLVVTDEVQQSYLADPSIESVPPIVVHCSGGAGRSGTFVTAHATFHQILNATKYQETMVTSEEGLRNVVNDNILRMRRQRHSFMVEGEDQYELIYHVLGLWGARI